jgi:hypothetical protein
LTGRKEKSLLRQRLKGRSTTGSRLL